MTIDMLMMQLGTIGWQEWAFLIFLSLPPFFVLYSRRVTGRQKLVWFVLTSLLSWPAYGLFLVMTRPSATATDDRSDGK